ncbi:MAG TPA: hypothetical protein VN795_00465 [Stellaceae bacterium]|nr:hypothetical protein [Stellaceae bacterium]
MRALKLLVIGLGVLLAAGVAALAVAVVQRHGSPPAPVTGSGTAVITLPPGAKIVSTEASGGRLVARIDLPDGGVELIIFDLANGARIATIDLAPRQP